MIQKFVDRFMERKKDLELIFKKKHIDNYEELVKTVISILVDDTYHSIDPECIHCIDDGECQGTLVFVIAEKNSSPDKYWYIKISYGSCSGCDTLESINSSVNEIVDIPTDEQVLDYMTLALHIVQGLKEMGDMEDDNIMKYPSLEQENESNLI